MSRPFHEVSSKSRTYHHSSRGGYHEGPRKRVAGEEMLERLSETNTQVSQESELYKPIDFAPKIPVLASPRSANLSEVASNRQGQLIVVAEQLLQDYYTRFSQDPSSLPSLYLDNAEVIYTGRELNVDAQLMTGKAEIEAFFKSPVAARFKGARVMVDALHPLASPLSSFGVVLFAKGKIWLPSQDPTSFTVTPFYHFLCMAPQPKSTSWSGPPQYFVANEYFHVSGVALQTEPFSSSTAVPSYVATEEPAQAPMVTQAPPAKEAETAAPPPPTRTRYHPEASKEQDTTLHAVPSTALDPSLSDSDLRELITAAVQRVPGCESGICLEISRPRQNPDANKAFFFIHLESVLTMSRLKQQGRIDLNGVSLQLSPHKPKPFQRKPYVPRGGIKAAAADTGDSSAGVEEPANRSYTVPYFHRSFRGRGEYTRGGRGVLRRASGNVKAKAAPVAGETSSSFASRAAALNEPAAARKRLDAAAPPSNTHETS